MLNRDPKIINRYAEKAMADYLTYGEGLKSKACLKSTGLTLLAKLSNLDTWNPFSSSSNDGIADATVASAQFQNYVAEYNNSDIPRICNELHSSRTFSPNILNYPMEPLGFTSEQPYY